MSRIFEPGLPEDKWAYLIGRFDTAESAFDFAVEESIRYGRRMLVLPPRRNRRKHWLVYPANTCQAPWLWGWNPGNRRCDQPFGHEGRHECTTRLDDGTISTVFWEDAAASEDDA